MNHKPIHLSISDITQTRVNSYHAHWPCDPDTTRRLDRVRTHGLQDQQRFRDRHSLLFLVLHGIVFFFIAGLGLIAAVIIREAIVGGS